MNRPRSRVERQSIRRTLAVPVLLAVTSLTGLIVALTGDGWRDVLSAFFLTLPLIVLAYAWAQRA